MSIHLKRVQDRLRLMPGVNSPDGRLTGGVLVFKDIPLSAIVTAYLDQPTELLTVSNGGQGAGSPVLATYKFEKGPLGAKASSGFIGGGVKQRTAAPVLVPTGIGPVVPFQVIPAFVAVGGASGSLAQKGRKQHSITMAGANQMPVDREWLRLRWTGTPVAGESQNARLVDPVSGATAWTPDGTRRSFKGKFSSTDNIAPGSVSFTATVGGSTLTILDDGMGRLTGLLLDANGVIQANAFGTVDYLTGIWYLTFGNPTPALAPDNASTISASYEHATNYIPIDVELEFDDILQ